MATVENKIIKNFFSKKELNILQKYCYNKIDSNKDYEIDVQCFSPAWYSDAILYAGCDQKHWRPGIYKGEGIAQTFFHYVNQNGPNRKHAYDK